MVFDSIGNVVPWNWKFIIPNIKPTYGFGLRLWIQELEILALEMDVG